MDLKNHSKLWIKQIFEGFELLGFETRNKYAIQDESGNPLGFAAEQGKGAFQFIARQFLGHWRTFTVHFFNAAREEIFQAHHPFRFFFQRLELSDTSGRAIGAIQQRLGVLYKRFDLEDAQGRVIMQMKSPVWKIWTFPIFRNDSQVACIRKKWSGLLAEGFTDKDKFLVEFDQSNLGADERTVILAGALFVDLQYFEKPAS